jgi:hypothetical protein
MSFANSAEQAAFRRSINDYFATPPCLTFALMRVEKFDGLIWECAAGEGWLSEVLKTRYEVLSTDLIDRGYGQGGVDFLKQTKVVPNIVTNPPYIDKMYLSFPEHALKLATRKVAMLLPWYLVQTLAFQTLLFDRPLRTIYAFRRRGYTVCEGSKGTYKTNVPFAWFVWEHGYKGRPTFEPITATTPPVSRLSITTPGRGRQASPATPATGSPHLAT